MSGAGENTISSIANGSFCSIPSHAMKCITFSILGGVVGSALVAGLGALIVKERYPSFFSTIRGRLTSSTSCRTRQPDVEAQPLFDYAVRSTERVRSDVSKTPDRSHASAPFGLSRMAPPPYTKCDKSPYASSTRGGYGHESSDNLRPPSASYQGGHVDKTDGERYGWSPL